MTSPDLTYAQIAADDLNGRRYYHIFTNDDFRKQIYVIGIVFFHFTNDGMYMTAIENIISIK